MKICVNALDALALALTEHGHSWTARERQLYEAAISSFSLTAPLHHSAPHLLQVPTPFVVGDLVQTPSGEGRITLIKGKILVGEPTGECDLRYRVLVGDAERWWHEGELKPMMGAQSI